jgi:hypothetical protein
MNARPLPGSGAVAAGPAFQRDAGCPAEVAPIRVSPANCFEDAESRFASQAAKTGLAAKISIIRLVGGILNLMSG